MPVWTLGGLHKKRPKAHDIARCSFFVCDGQALQEWQRIFEAENHRTPLVWLDKACLKQDDIARNLQVLPVSLAGCKGLLILLGDSYPSRLWCMMELFIFLAMGGSMEQITVADLNHKQPVELSMNVQRSDRLTKVLDNFDIKKATCYKVEDAKHLKCVVKECFGSLDFFNDELRRLLGNAITTGAADCASRLSILNELPTSSHHVHDHGM